MRMTIATNPVLAVAVMVLGTSIISSTEAFLPHSRNNIINSNNSLVIVNDGGKDGDPTKVWYAGIADAVQNLLTNSPLNEGKKALVRKLAGEYDQVAIRAKLDGFIANEPVLMLSFVKWPFCVKAKAILNGLGVSYKVIEVDEDPDGKALRAEMADVIGRTSVPAIWIGGEFIGGCNDGPRGGINTLQQSGELTELLTAVGAL